MALLKSVFLSAAVILTCINSAVSVAKDSEADKKNESNDRQGKTYDAAVQRYGDVLVYEDSVEPSTSVASGPHQDTDYKGYNRFVQESHNHPVAYDLKGYPYYPAISKGAWPKKYPAVTVDQMMKMMTMMNTVEKAMTEKEQDTGLLSQFLSDPLPAILSLIVPLAVLFLALAPFLGNLFKGASSVAVPLIATTAGRDARQLLEGDFAGYATLLQNVVDSLEGDHGCVQERMCRWATKGGLKTAAENVLDFVNEDLVKGLGVRSLLDAVRQGKCEGLCKLAETKPRPATK